ncbi:MAG: hypothetical protein C0592_12455 [Marinilabiliales bacterium]|nr:MAG: hypothetical protein C0592_12455 [Marinilabiliales bacterium]
MKTLYIFALTGLISTDQLLGQNQLPFNTGDYQPVELRTYTPPLDINNTDNEFVSYSEGTFIGKIKSSVEFEAKPLEPEIIYPTITEEKIDEDPDFNLKSFSNLIAADQITGFPNYPISSIVKLYITLSDGNSVTCSGALIRPDYVLTAGHCVYTPTSGPYMTSAYVVPAYNLGNSPYGYATSSNFSAFTQWMYNYNWSYDVALIRLDQNIGNTVGYLGLNYSTNNSFFTSSGNTFHSFGYPSADYFGNPHPDQGERMYYWYGYFDSWYSGNIFCHYPAGYKGQSGSAFYYNDGSNLYALGALSHYGPMPDYYNTCHCRIDQSMYNDIYSTVMSVDETDKPTIKLFPSPFTDNVTISASEYTKNARILVYNNIGQLIKEQSFNNKIDFSIDMTGFQNGLYLFKIILDEYTYEYKAIKTE